MALIAIVTDTHFWCKRRLNTSSEQSEEVF